MDPWYRVATPRKEVREGRSFTPDEFAIALEQVVADTASEDYRDPQQFFGRTWFGGGKTHTLTALYHFLHVIGTGCTGTPSSIRSLGWRITRSPSARPPSTSASTSLWRPTSTSRRRARPSETTKAAQRSP